MHSYMFVQLRRRKEKSKCVDMAVSERAGSSAGRPVFTKTLLSTFYIFHVWLICILLYVEGDCLLVEFVQVLFSAWIPGTVNSGHVCGHTAEVFRLLRRNYSAHTHTRSTYLRALCEIILQVLIEETYSWRSSTYDSSCPLNLCSWASDLWWVCLGWSGWPPW